MIYLCSPVKYTPLTSVYRTELVTCVPDNENISK